MTRGDGPTFARDQLLDGVTTRRGRRRESGRGTARRAARTYRLNHFVHGFSVVVGHRRLEFGVAEALKLGPRPTPASQGRALRLHREDGLARWEVGRGHAGFERLSGSDSLGGDTAAPDGECGSFGVPEARRRVAEELIEPEVLEEELRDVEAVRDLEDGGAKGRC